MQRLDLRTQIVRHRRAMRFIVLKQFITESLPLGIKHDDSVGRLILQDQASQHIQHAIHCACRFTSAIRQRGERVICPIKVRGAVNEDERVFWDLNHNFRACLSDYG